MMLTIFEQANSSRCNFITPAGSQTKSCQLIILLENDRRRGIVDRKLNLRFN